MSYGKNNGYGFVKIRLNFNISRHDEPRSAKLRRSFALSSLYLRSESGKWAKLWRHYYVAGAELVRKFNEKMVFCLFCDLGF